ncbi:MAG TPA: hypothetical protein VIM66_07075 [Candidatus Limnocylindria bacterium]
MKNLKTLGIAGGLVTAALVGGTLINAVLAAPSASPASGSAAALADKGAYCDTWTKAFADKLGVSVGDLLPAAKAATVATIDAAVAAGDLTAERAAALKTKIEAATGNACRFLGHPFFGPGHGPKAVIGGDLVSAAAKALGMTPAALTEALRKGDSLKDVASSQGKDYHAVSQAVHDAAKADLDKAVANGLDQTRANELLSKLDAALAAGDFPHFGPGRGNGGFPWFRHDAANESPEPAPAT